MTKKYDWNPIWEATKEPLRLLVLAILPFGMAYLTEVDWQFAGVATLLLRFVDSIMHEVAKAEPAKTRNEGLLGEHGLTGF